MANEIELANILHQTDVVASVATEAFVTMENPFPLILTEAFPDTTNVILFGHLDKVEAGDGTESTAYSYGADDEMTDTSTTVTGTRKDQSQKITLEAARFAKPYETMERHVRAATQALIRHASSELKTLFSSVATGVTATSTLTKDNLLDARYNVRSSVKDRVGSKLVGWFDYKGMNELGKELTDTTATAWTQQLSLGLLGMPTSGAPKGELFDIVLFETDGLPTSGGDDVACVWDPSNAFVAGVDGINGFQFRVKEPSSQEPWFELYMWTFWNIAEHNDTAACRVLSDT